MWQFALIISKSLTGLVASVFTVIRAKVVGKKLLTDGPFGTMRYTVKQMKVGVMNTRCSMHQQTPHSCQELGKKVIFLACVSLNYERNPKGEGSTLGFIQGEKQNSCIK